MSNILNRISKLRSLMAERKIEAVLITKKENRIYFAEFTGTHAYLIVTMNDLIILTDFRYIEQAKVQALGYTVVQIEKSVNISLKEIISSKNVKIIGVEGGDITYAKYLEFEEVFTGLEVQAFGDEIDNIRMVKDEDEINLIQEAVDIADEGFDHILNYIKPGISEIDIAIELEYYMKKRGAQKASFEIIVASGKRSSMPHGVASKKIIKNGDIITMDFGAVYQGYCSDITRTVFLGTPNEHLKNIYDVVLKAQISAIEYAKEGLRAVEVDFHARNIINRAGFERNFGHALGHGVGLEIHEAPTVPPSNKTVLLENMVVTIEPGIYIEELGGVRIEDVIVIKKDKSITLTKANKQVIII